MSHCRLQGIVIPIPDSLVIAAALADVMECAITVGVWHHMSGVISESYKCLISIVTTGDVS